MTTTPSNSVGMEPVSARSASQPTPVPADVGIIRTAKGSFRAVGVATQRPLLGTCHYARKLNSHLGIPTLATERPVADLVERIQHLRAKVCHLQFEYRTFGGAVRTFRALPTFARRVSRTTRLVVTIHGLPTREGATRWSDRIRLRAYRSLLRKACRYASKVTVLSERMRYEIETTYGIFGAVVIPHGSDYFPSTMIPATPPYLLFFGFLRPSKGVLELLEAFDLIARDHPDLRLVIAGGPAKEHERSYLDQIDRTISKHPFRERISLRKGFIDWSEKDVLARSASLIVLPYKDSFAEVSGVVHDVAASGVPVVCSTIPRFAELMDGVEALHVAPQPEFIARGIRRVLSDNQLKDRLSKGIREKARRESWSEVARAHTELFDMIVAGRSAPPIVLG